ncbi:hypothetical protein HNP73_000275 [Amaricoccus macauensis]|uniref:Uncharacterized protein n=1 Tax=Amaricoccus macauensis TaxID=57001 RepID=A0A840SHE9_9RHOB|nr:hypothetical protein [Amaricoccus macauensis]MBB5220354.1 hypothetical protein [Amaricoccus macauensis]
MRVEVAGAEYRAGSAYRFVPVDRLTAEERSAVGNLADDPEIYALLIPLRDGAQTVKAIDSQTALVYLTLREPGPLPSLMRAALRDDLSAAVARLVLDGVLEIRTGADFVSGADAVALLNLDSNPSDPRGRLARLSIQALRYGQHLDIQNVQTLAGRLYAFNRLVLTPSWGQRLPTRESTAVYLGIGDDRGSVRPPSPGWVAQGGAMTSSSWLAWHSGAPISRAGHGPVYKLYVSPQPSAVAECLRICAEIVRKRGAHALKVGADVHGLLRPDKLVAYFGTFESLGEAAASLAPRLAGMPAHGVPFTAEITPDGMLSWGVDPPRQEHELAWTGESWRVWVAGRLASALVAARTASNSGEPWRYALERIALEGIDPSIWVPSQGVFAAGTGA